MEEKKIVSPIKAIRAYCIGCMCGQVNEVKLCPIKDCELYPFRFGKNPYLKKEVSPEERARMAERMKQNFAKNTEKNSSI